MGSEKMCTYYRDPNLTYHSEDRFNPNVSLPNAIAQHADDQHNGEQPQATGPTRYCSVRGCTSVLPPNYGNKMCEVCRGRHRVYASTKRAKRKMEKAALGMQNGWIPTEDDPPPNEPSSSPTADVQENTSPEHTHAQYTYPGTSWESTTLDPRLFQVQPSSSSELAGALTLLAPPSSRPRSPTQAQVSTLHPSSSVLPEASGSAASGSIAAPVFPPYHRSESVQPGQSTPQKEISVQSISEVAAIQPNGSLPPRFCSIKGCKTVMDGNSLFKMCDVCRGKYKTYGTTKRKKWKEEKTKALEEMEKEREEQNRIRAEQGLPPLPSIDTLTWPEETIAGRAINSSIPRMCTVSHCREVLPVGYEYLRCERHRIQNRHHSKLKRVRDKDAKAHALEGFFATMAGATSFQQVESSPSEEMFVEGSSGDGNHVPITEIYRMDEEKRAEEVDLNIVEPQAHVFGVPPAARGVRRTNHVCSIKGCHNLLSPTTPWKMCDDCRAHERSVRKIRALRESGVMVEPLPPRLPPREKKEKLSKEKRAKSRKRDVPTEDGEVQSPESSSDVDGLEGGVVFMDPVLLGAKGEVSEPHTSTNAEISFVMADEQGNLPERPEAARTQATSAEFNDASSSMAADIPDSAAPPAVTKKKTSKKTGTAKSQGSLTNQAATSSSAQAPVPSMPAPAQSHLSTATPTPAPYPPSYVPSYYAPPPGYALQYPPGAPYPYAPGPHPSHLPPAFPRDGFAPSPMYQPPYSAYPGYPPPYPPPYGYYPPSFGPYLQPPLPSTSQTPTPPTSAPPQPQAAAGASEAGSSFPTGAIPMSANYSTGVVSYVTAASGGSATSPSTPSSSGWFPPPPPPPDRSSMYSMFPVRLTDPSKTVDSSAPAQVANGSILQPQVVTANGERQKEGGMIWVDRPPEKRKRRKANLAAVEAYIKKREEERIRAESGAAEHPSGVPAEESAPVAAMNEQLAAPEIGMDVDASRAGGPGVQSTAVEVLPVRSCINKMCSRKLSATETGTICVRCKEKMKKRAMKVKKRFKLVMPSSKSAAKQPLKSQAFRDADVGHEDDEMDEVMVDEALATSLN